MTKILIAGDSFATDEEQSFAWTQLLASKFKVTNIAQAGISEYKILKQIQSVNVKDFDLVIVSHTSYSRIHIPNHPLHKQGKHKNCDLIYNDINRFSLFNKPLQIAKGWFEYFYDDSYQKDIYHLMRKEIKNICQDTKYLSISHLRLPAKFAKREKYFIDFNYLWTRNRGDVCHYNEKGNREVYNRIYKFIETCV